jgi:PAS domain S-box-containing protein
VAREVFGIPQEAEDILAYSILDRYANPEDRPLLLSLMRENAGRLLNHPIELDVGGRMVIVLDSCLYVPGARGGEDVLGVVCDVTELMADQQLLEHLPVAVYEVAEDGTFRRANERVAEILLGCGDGAQLEGKNISRYYAREEDARAFAEEIRTKGSAKNRILDMVRADGTPIIVQVSAERLVRKGHPNGRFGAFTDVTASQKVSRALERLPTGYYEVVGDGIAARITRCTSAFARMFGYKAPSQMEGKVRAYDVHASHAEWEKYMEALRAAEEADQPLDNYELHVRRRDGTLFWVQIDCRMEKAAEKVLGRAGTVRDITAQVELRQTVTHLQGQLESAKRSLLEVQGRLEQTTEDVDRFVHQYVAPILKVESALELQRLTLRATGGIPVIARLDDFMVEAIRLEEELLIAVDTMRGAESETHSIIADGLTRLRVVLSRRHMYESSPIEHVTIFAVAGELLRYLHTCPDAVTHDPAIEALRSRASIVSRMAVARSIDSTLLEARALKAIVEAFRRQLSNAPQTYEFRQVNLVGMIVSTIEAFTPMALEEKARAITYRGEREIMCDLADVHIDRMLSNLVHNAIKYSYKGRHGRDDVISVRVSKGDNLAIIEIGNYGVPIKAEEIETGRIFEFGYRGVFSKDYNRTGSGVGLSDALDTVVRHGGTLEVTSVPAEPGASRTDYSRPFTTVVRITLPLHHEAGG